MRFSANASSSWFLVLCSITDNIIIEIIQQKRPGSENQAFHYWYKYLDLPVKTKRPEPAANRRYAENRDAHICIKAFHFFKVY
jgi:hypothetical protein